MKSSPQPKDGFQALIEIVEILRGPDGCPWDKEQTHKSLVRFLSEEAFEAIEAIENEDLLGMKEELGDLLFQVVLQAEIAKQAGNFDIFDVIRGISEKMVRRHPHVFAEDGQLTSEQVLTNWESIKAAEKKAIGGSKPASGPFDWPKSLPALLRSHKIGVKSRSLQFDWQSHNEVLVKIREELTELEEALSQQEPDKVEEEFGDLLFSLAQWARHAGFDAEGALRKANAKFENRFSKMLNHCDFDLEVFKDLPADQKEQLWGQVKKTEAR